MSDKLPTEKNVFMKNNEFDKIKMFKSYDSKFSELENSN